MEQTQYLTTALTINLIFESFAKKITNDHCSDKDKKIDITRYKAGDTIQIANIDCKLIEKNGEIWKLEILSSVSTKMATNVLSDASSALYDEEECLKSIGGIPSCDSEREESQFYLTRSDELQKIFKQLCNRYKLQKCYSCSEIIDLNEEYVENNGKKYCSDLCSQSFEI